MALIDEINAARQGGKTDDELLDAYKAYDPSKASTIDSSLQSGMSSTDILNALGAYDAQYGNHVENQSLWSRAEGALQQGASSELTGLGTTAKETLGPGAVSDTLTDAGRTIAPQGYQPASDGLADPNKTIGDRAGYIPRSMAEGAPGLATDVAAGAAGARIGGAVGLLGGPFAEVTAPVGAAIGGALGFGGSYLLRNYGSDAERAAQARTGDPNAVPNDDDRNRALAAGVASAALSRFGVTEGLGEGVTGAGTDAVLSTLGGMGKAAAIDAGTGAVSNAVNTALVDRKDPTTDPSGLMLSGLQGAVAGTGLRSLTAAGDAYNTYRFSDIDPENGNALANLYRGMDFSTPAKAYESVSRMDSLLNVYADHWADKTQPQIDALDQDSGFTDYTGLSLKSARQVIAGGGILDPAILDGLRERLGDWYEGSNLLDTLTLQNTQNQLKSVGNFRPSLNGKGTFSGALADTDFVKTVLSPVGKLGKIGPSALGLDLGVAHFAPSAAFSPALLSILGAAQLGVNLGVMGMDGILRTRNPIEEFSKRFGLADLDPDPIRNFSVTSGLEKPSFIEQSRMADSTGPDIAELATRALAKGRLMSPPDN